MRTTRFSLAIEANGANQVSTDTNNEVSEVHTNSGQSTVGTILKPDVQQSTEGTSSVPYNSVERGTIPLLKLHDVRHERTDH